MTSAGAYQPLSWKAFQQRPADPGRLSMWFAHSPLGIGIVCGRVSGITIGGVHYALEVLDIDDEEVLEQFIEAAHWQGLTDVLQRMVHQRTPRRGRALCLPLFRLGRQPCPGQASQAPGRAGTASVRDLD